MTADEVRVRVGGSRHAAAEARRVLAEKLDGRLSEDVKGAFDLLVSELVNNSVLHGGAIDGGEIRIRVVLEAEVVYAEVCDRGPGLAQPPRRVRDERVGGWGLVFVQELARRWGTQQNAHSCVWFELDRDAGTPAEGQAA